MIAKKITATLLAIGIALSATSVAQADSDNTDTAGALESINVEQPTTIIRNTRVSDQHRSQIIDFGEYQGLKYKVVSESPVYPPGTVVPNMKVGAGKFLYLYVNKAEFNGLSTAAGAAYSGAVCGAIGTATSLVGGVACTAITQGIFAYVRTRDAPNVNQCGEIKLMWGVFAPVGYKVINKPCSKV